MMLEKTLPRLKKTKDGTNDYVIIARLNSRPDVQKFHDEITKLRTWILKNGDVITHDGKKFIYTDKE